MRIYINVLLHLSRKVHDIPIRCSPFLSAVPSFMESLLSLYWYFQLQSYVNPVPIPFTPVTHDKQLHFILQPEPPHLYKLQSKYHIHRFCKHVSPLQYLKEMGNDLKSPAAVLSHCTVVRLLPSTMWLKVAILAGRLPWQHLSTIFVTAGNDLKLPAAMLVHCTVVRFLQEQCDLKWQF